MKKTIFTVVMISISCIATAQETKTTSEDAKKLVTIWYGEHLERTIKMMTQMSPPDKKETNDKLIATSKAKLVAKLAAQISKTYSSEDLRNIIDFYESETGKKVRANTDNDHSEIFQIIQNWEIKMHEKSYEILRANNKEEAVKNREEQLSIKKDSIH